MNKLIEYCCKMNMSYSYKPVLIMALVEYGGEIHILDAVDYFVQYYARRLTLGLIAERTNSIYSNIEGLEIIILSTTSQKEKDKYNYHCMWKLKYGTNEVICKQKQTHRHGEDL